MAHRLVGIDEVGRGCWAGPLVAAAVLLDSQIDGLKDSKKLTKLQRQKLDKIIRERAVSIGIGWVWPGAIDSGGITLAVKNAMTEALLSITEDFDEVIIDGNYNYLANFCSCKDSSCKAKNLPNTLCKDSSCKEVRTEVGADGRVPAVSAASIVAKVARDNYMVQLASEYPGYGFDQHVGYGTPAHIEALKRFGVTKIHRRCYKPIQALLQYSDE